MSEKYNEIMDKILPFAACFAVIIVGSLLASVFRNVMPGDMQLQVSPEKLNTIETCVSAEALSQVVHFTVEELPYIPFEVVNTTYTSYWGEIAEIEYTGGGNQQATYRKSIGSEDNSGDYNDYSSMEYLSISNMQVTLKGEGNQFNLAQWGSDDYTYSVRMTEALSVSEWEKIIGAVRQY